MAMDPRIDELLLRWRELRQHGQDVAAEALCADAPELLPEFRRALRAVEQMEQWLDMGALNTPKPPPAAPTIGDSPSGKDPAVLPLPGFAIPGYELQDILGQGGMGIVYKARQTRLKRPVAVKMLRFDLHVKPQQLARFRVEAEA